MEDEPEGGGYEMMLSIHDVVAINVDRHGIDIYSKVGYSNEKQVLTRTNLNFSDEAMDLEYLSVLNLPLATEDKDWPIWSTYFSDTNIKSVSVKFHMDKIVLHTDGGTIHLNYKRR